MMKKGIRILALALVFCLCLGGLLPVDAAKMEFTDRDQIQDHEAVDVVTFLQLMYPYADQSFGPDKQVTREEAAVIMTRLDNLNEDISDLLAQAVTYADVSPDRWSAKYIVYCAQLGIFDHLDRLYFYPERPLTGIDTLPMLLTILGFDSDEMGYEESGWKKIALHDAEKIQLLRGFGADFNWEQPLNREQLARLILNALEARAVVGNLEYDDLEDEDIQELLWDILQKYTLMTGKNAVAVVSDQLLYDLLYAGRLEKQQNQDRTFTWVYHKNQTSFVEIGTYPAWS